MATLSFYAVVDWHWLSLLRGVHSSLAAIAAIFCQNDSVAGGKRPVSHPRNVNTVTAFTSPREEMTANDATGLLLECCLKQRFAHRLRGRPDRRSPRVRAAPPRVWSLLLCCCFCFRRSFRLVTAVHPSSAPNAPKSSSASSSSSACSCACTGAPCEWALPIACRNS